jgi:hypothetical protein
LISTVRHNTLGEQGRPETQKGPASRLLTGSRALTCRSDVEVFDVNLAAASAQFVGKEFGEFG